MSSTVPCVAGRCASSHASRPPTSSSESSPISPPPTPTPYPVHAPHQASSRSEPNRRARPRPNSRPRHHPSFPHSAHLHATANAAPRLSRTSPRTFLATVVALPPPLPSSEMHRHDRELSALSPVTDRPVSIPIPLQQRRSAGCFSYPRTDEACESKVQDRHHPYRTLLPRRAEWRHVTARSRMPGSSTTRSKSVEAPGPTEGVGFPWARHKNGPSWK